MAVVAPPQNAYQDAAANATFYPPASYDPPRPFNPYVALNTASSAGQTPGIANIPLIGLLLIAGVILFFHHLSLRAGASGNVRL